MPQDFYELGYAGTSNGNIHYQRSILDGVRTGSDSLLTAIKFWMADSSGNNGNNIKNVGHRRWILNPRARQTGFGISCRRMTPAMAAVMSMFWNVYFSIGGVCDLEEKYKERLVMSLNGCEGYIYFIFQEAFQ
jgi:hypothetical protein